jgi:hypothetical protein
MIRIREERLRMRRLVLLLALISLVPSAPVSAQTAMIGTEVMPTRVESAYDKLPEGELGLRGDVVTMLTPGTAFRLVERRVVSSVMGDEEWLRLEPTANSGESPCAQTPCWVFNRRMGETQSVLRGASSF